MLTITKGKIFNVMTCGVVIGLLRFQIYIYVASGKVQVSRLRKTNQ